MQVVRVSPAIVRDEHKIVQGVPNSVVNPHVRGQSAMSSLQEILRTDRECDTGPVRTSCANVQKAQPTRPCHHQ